MPNNPSPSSQDTIRPRIDGHTSTKKKPLSTEALLLLLCSCLIVIAFLSGSNISSTTNTPTQPLVEKRLDSLSPVYLKNRESVVIISIEKDPSELVGLPDEIVSLMISPDTGGISLPDEQGSGIILDTDGYVVTNKHIVADALPNSIVVKLFNGKELPATLVGVDNETDIALLKISYRDLKPARLGDSSSVRVGDIACAIGSPYTLPYTFTAGVISAIGRNDLTDSAIYENYIQTDTAIHPGNSGGPLLNINGEVIGINTLISGINRGLGFAMPSNTVKDVVARLKRHGKIQRPWLGVELVALKEGGNYAAYFAPIKTGAIVVGVSKDSTASASNIKPGDIIVKCNSRQILAAKDVQMILNTKNIGDTVMLTIVRSGVEKIVPVVLQEKKTLESLPVRKSPPLPVVRDQEPVGIYFAQQSDQLLVENVDRLSLAKTAGITSGDLIVAVDGVDVKTLEMFTNQINKADFKKGVMLTVSRSGRTGFALLRRNRTIAPNATPKPMNDDLQSSEHQSPRHK